jgi:3-hydroxyisobutyrate dehydrogenase-like beta-hydroxyacid dehydrogenase
MKNQESLPQSLDGENNDAIKVARPHNGAGPSDAAAGSFDQVGFIGLGRMGTAMATNLVAAGFKVRAYVRQPARAAELTALGLIPTSNIRDLFGCGIVATMVTDDQAVRDIFFGNQKLGVDGFAAGLMPGAIHLSMSTIGPATAAELATQHVQLGLGYVAAPVLGNPEAAAARELFIMAAGAAIDVERCRPVLDALGRQTFVIGSDPAAANLVKLAGNMLTATSLEMLGEIVALLRKRNIDPELVLGIFTATMFGSRVHKIYGEKIVHEQYTPSNFVLPLALKDVRLALAEAEAAGVPMPSVNVVRDRLVAGIARGHENLDWSALGLIAAEEAGLAPRPLPPI